MSEQKLNAGPEVEEVKRLQEKVLGFEQLLQASAVQCPIRRSALIQRPLWAGKAQQAHSISKFRGKHLNLHSNHKILRLFDQDISIWAELSGIDEDASISENARGEIHQYTDSRP